MERTEHGGIMNEQPVLMNKHSSRITQPKSQGASQAMLLATGLSQSDLNQAQIGIAACWYEGNPCNMQYLFVPDLSLIG